MDADEVYNELSSKIEDLTNKNSEFQGTIDYLQSSITDLKNSVESMKSDLEFVKAFVQRSQQESQAASDAADEKARIDELKAQIQKMTDDLNAQQKAAADNAGVLSKIGDQIDATATTIVKNAIDNSKKEILGIWEDGKKAINNSLSDFVTSQIKDLKTSVLNDVKGMFLDLDAKPKPVLENDLDAKVRTIITTVQGENAEALTDKIKEVITENQTENTDTFNQKVNTLITTYAQNQGWTLRS
jgi:chromosome segregation ATPase